MEIEEGLFRLQSLVAAKLFVLSSSSLTIFLSLQRNVKNYFFEEQTNKNVSIVLFFLLPGVCRRPGEY